MNDLKVFKNSEFGELGVLVIEGKEYFPAIQCAKALGYVNPRKAILDHCKGVTKCDVPTAGGTQEVKFIPEGDLYRLIIRSKLPEAERFERWVFDEVLPELHRAGSYGNINIEEIISRTATAVVSEVVKQLAPALLRMQYPGAVEEAPPPIQRKRIKTPIGVISSLDPMIIRELDDMIASERYTYFQLMDFLKQEFDVKVSYSSMQRYATRLLRSLK